jgi:FixJ family two-component response regulator
VHQIDRELVQLPRSGGGRAGRATRLSAAPRELGFAGEAFASAEDFLSSAALYRTRCLLLDVAMPGTSGPALQAELVRLRRPIPIVFISAHVDERVRGRLLQAGAVACLYKPFTESELLRAVNAAMELSA